MHEHNLFELEEHERAAFLEATPLETIVGGNHDAWTDKQTACCIGAGSSG